MAMVDPKQLPELASELFGMSKQYLLEQTVEPAKRLGKTAGFGIGGGVVFAIAAIFGTLGVYAGFQALFDSAGGDHPWLNVLARGLTALVAAAVAGLVAWRMNADG